MYKLTKEQAGHLYPYAVINLPDGLEQLYAAIPVIDNNGKLLAVTKTINLYGKFGSYHKVYNHKTGNLDI